MKKTGLVWFTPAAVPARSLTGSLGAATEVAQLNQSAVNCPMVLPVPGTVEPAGSTVTAAFAAPAAHSTPNTKIDDLFMTCLLPAL